MTPLGSEQLDSKGDVVGRNGLVEQRSAQERVIAPRASDRERVVARTVEVDEQPARDECRVERLCPVEALLLGHGEEELERPTRDLDVIRHGHRSGDADTVVGSERRAVGAYPVVLDTDV